MKVIIVGMSKVGKTLLAELCKVGHSVVAIEQDATVLQECVNQFDIQGICGNGCIAENLKEAGVKNCDMLIAVTPQDENNILCCMVARVLGAKSLVARVRDPQYFDQFEFMHGELGIGLLVNPEESLSHEIERILRFPAAVKVSSFARNKIDIVEFKLPHGSKLEGLTLAQVRKSMKSNVLVIAYERDGKTEIPNGETVLRGDDTVTVCGRHGEMRHFFRTFGLLKHKIQSVFILGGGKDAFYLARNLEESGFSVKIIEQSHERCLEIKSKLEKTQVICGDYTDSTVLQAEGISDADAVICMTPYDENNIVTALYAKRVGVLKTVSVVRGESYRGMLEGIGIDTAVSPYRLAASDVIRYLRTVDVREESQVKALYKIANEKAEGLLFAINHDERFVGKSLRELNLPKGVLIAAIARGRTSLIPNGDTVLEQNDNIVVVSTGKQILKLDDILSL